MFVCTAGKILVRFIYTVGNFIWSDKKFLLQPLNGENAPSQITPSSGRAVENILFLSTRHEETEKCCWKMENRYFVFRSEMCFCLCKLFLVLEAERSQRKRGNMIFKSFCGAIFIQELNLQFSFNGTMLKLGCPLVSKSS